jgi:hypothetical protein
MVAGVMDLAEVGTLAQQDRVVDPATQDQTKDLADPVTALIESGAGRGRIARELGVTEYQARQLIASSRNGVHR